MNKTKGDFARRVKDAKVFHDFSSYIEGFFYRMYYINAKNYNIKQLLIILLKDTKSYGGRKERYSTVGLPLYFALKFYLLRFSTQFRLIFEPALSVLKYHTLYIDVNATRAVIGRCP